MKWNEVHSKHTKQTNPAAEQNKNITWSESPWNQSGQKGKGLWGKNLPKSRVLSSEWKTEQVKEGVNGDSEDSEDDELPCVMNCHVSIVLVCRLSMDKQTVQRKHLVFS